MRLGYDADDIENMADVVVDAVVAWGSIESIKKRVQDHFDAGADHVCVQVLTEEPQTVPEGWRQLAPALVG